MLQTNTVRGLPELWEEAVTDDLQAEVLDGTTPAAVAERQIAYLEQGRLVASLGSSFLPDFQAAEPAGEPLLISDRIRSELNGKFRELEQTAGEPQRSIELSPDALIKGEAGGSQVADKRQRRGPDFHGPQRRRWAGCVRGEVRARR